MLIIFKYSKIFVYIIILLMAISGIGSSVIAQNGFWIMAKDLALGGQPGWEYYDGTDSPEGAFLGWIRTGNTLDGTIALQRNLTPKPYYVFLKVIDYSEQGEIEIALGGEKATIKPDSRDWNDYWTFAAPLKTIASATSLKITLLRTDFSDPEQKYLLRGLYITSDSTEIVTSDDRIINIKFSSESDKRPPVKGNILENSSFEVGLGHGWGTPSPNRSFAVTAFWDNTVFYHGRACLKLPAESEILSKAYMLKPNKLYTLSAWTKSSASTICQLLIYNVSNTSPALGSFMAKTINIGTKWQRVSFSVVLANFSTNYYQIGFYVPQANTWVDAIQLEEGALSDYNPRKPLEIGLMSNHASNVFLEDEPISADLLAYNNNNQVVSAKVRYEIYDYLNRRIKNDSLSLSLTARNVSMNSLDLSTGKRGIFRVFLWLDSAEGTEEEVVYSILPRPQNMGIDENSMIGIHPNFVDFQLEALQRMGIKWARIMSPSAFFRWSVIEPTEGNLIWHDKEIQSAARYGITVLGTIGTNDYWPAWADSGGLPRLDKWETFVEKLVQHYKNEVKYWEIWNEPIYNFTAAFYAEMLKRAASAVRRNDPTAKIIGMGGIYDYRWILEVIGYLGNDWASYMDYISTHIYYTTSLGAKDFKRSIIDKFNIPVWNTEAGMWDLGFYKGSNSNFFIQGEPIWPHQESARYYDGALGAAERLTVNFLHCIGNGLTRYFYYDSRLELHPGYLETHPTIIEYDDTIRAKGIAYAILAYLFDYSKGLGNISTDPNTYAYLFDRGGTPLIALWTANQSNKSVTISTAQIKAYDMMGSMVQTTGSTIQYNRTPIYIEGQGISVDGLKNAFQQGTISPGLDRTPPNLSIVSCPSGPTKSRSLRLRWIAIDETSTPSTVNPYAILYSYQLLGRDPAWSLWTAKTYVDYDNLNPGHYVFCVQAKDEQGNLSAKACKDIFIIQPQISPPQNLRATFKQYVELSWSPNGSPDVSLYGIYRSPNLESTFALIDTVGQLDSMYVDVDIQSDSLYFYTATAFDRLGNESGFSNIVEMRIPLLTSVGLIEFSGHANDDDVVLEWSMAGEPAARSFEVQRRQDNESEFKKIGFVKEWDNAKIAKKYRFIDKDLAVGNYYYRLQQIDVNGAHQFSSIINIYIAPPTEFRLYQNHPNPFNSSTTISYSLPQSSQVELKVYNINGREVSKIVDAFQVVGRYRVNWDGTNIQGEKVASGIYYYRIRTSQGSKFGKMILLE